MAKIIRLTESDLKKIIKSSANRILREYIGDEEELGRYDLANGLTDEDFYNIDAMNAEAYQQEEDDMKDYAEQMQADEWIGREFWDPSDGDLYRGSAW